MIKWVSWKNNSIYVEKKLNVMKVVFNFSEKSTERQVYIFIVVYKLLQKLNVDFSICVKVDDVENVDVQHCGGETLNWTLSQSWRNVLISEMTTGFNSVTTKQKDIEMIRDLFMNLI